jgi:hypothetical protein
MRTHSLKQEIWKARHPNITLLEPDNDAVQLLMTKMRDGSVDGATFRFYADRLLNFLAEVRGATAHHFMCVSVS